MKRPWFYKGNLTTKRGAVFQAYGFLKQYMIKTPWGWFKVRNWEGVTLIGKKGEIYGQTVSD